MPVRPRRPTASEAGEVPCDARVEVRAGQSGGQAEEIMLRRKRFGQHFLEPVWADKVLRAIDPSPADRFLEIGPGAGALTLRLAPTIAHLTAVEIEPGTLPVTEWCAMTCLENLPYSTLFPALQSDPSPRLSEWMYPGFAPLPCTSK